MSRETWLSVAAFAALGWLGYCVHTYRPEEQEASNLEWLLATRKVHELTDVPAGVRCFAILTPNGHVPATLACFPRADR